VQSDHWSGSLEKLDLLGNLKAVREMSEKKSCQSIENLEMSGNVRELSGENLVWENYLLIVDFMFGATPVFCSI